jgi:carboxypeptidase Q
MRVMSNADKGERRLQRAKHARAPRARHTGIRQLHHLFLTIRVTMRANEDNAGVNSIVISDIGDRLARTRKMARVCSAAVLDMTRRLSIFRFLPLAALLSISAPACSDDPANPGGTAGGSGGAGGAGGGGQSGAGGARDAAAETGTPIDASVDAGTPPPQGDAAVDRRPSDAGGDAAADVSRPNDAVTVDVPRVDVSADTSTPPTNDGSTPETGGGTDGTVVDTVGPTPDAGCDSTLKGVDLFRCQALTYGKPLEILQDLTTTVGPRLAGTAGFANAVTWATAKLTAMGLQNVKTEAVTVPHWERGIGHAELLGTTEKPLAIAALGGSVGTATGGLEAEVIEVASVSALNALSNSQVQGKIVFVNVVTQRTKDASGYGAAVSARRSGPAAAAGKGAVGYIVRSITPATDNAPHTGDMNNSSIPSVAIGVADALVLSDAVKAGTTRVRITLGCQSLASVQAANVIGEFVGKDAPGEILLLGAHLDSWDLATGAHDDGAGVAMVAEAARLISVYAPDTRRTVRVVLFANEEFGLSGANAYASAHSSELAKHVMALEADLGGDRVYGATFQAGSSATTTIRDLLAPLAPLGVDPATTGGDYGADLGPIRRQGVPVAELAQDLTRYFDFHHAPTDTMAAIDAAALQQATAAVSVFAYQLARSSADFGRSNLTLTAPEHEH